MDSQSDATSQEPEVKYLILDICETYQEGTTAWDNRVKHLLIGDDLDVEAARELRASFEDGKSALNQAYKRNYARAGKHFAVGDSVVRSELTRNLHILAEVVERLQRAPNDAISGIPCLPSSFHRYTLVNYALLRHKSNTVRKSCLAALQDLFTKISDWAVPLHTLPPLASPPTSSPPEAEPEAEGFFDKVRAPFHRHRYVYDELPTQYSIRLVKINTSRPSVTCQISTFHLTDPPPFQALSYCWGKSGQNSEIWCNDGLFKVSSNLKKGLQRLYRMGESSHVNWFYQICINQNDIGERTQQVRLMRAIYQRATRTVIWLGADDRSVREAFSLTNEIYLHIVGEKEKVYYPGEELSTMEQHTKLISERDSRWAALSRFLELPWFERCWIIQEVVVSQGDPVLLCGGYQTDWSRFQTAMVWIAKHNPTYGMERMKLVHAISNLSSTSHGWELQSLLHSTRAFLATDPRDKVYALLGLAGESRDPDRWPKALLPNYDRSMQDVYTKVTLYCIQRTESLTILSQVDKTFASTDDARDANYPSWVPRWDLPQLPNYLSAYVVNQSIAGWQTLAEKFNCASKNLSVSLDAQTSPDVLRLEGIRVSTVESCLPVMYPDQAQFSTSTIMSAHPNLMNTVPKLFEMCRARFHHLSRDEYARAFFLVTTAGLTQEQGDATKEYLWSFHAFIRATAPQISERHLESASMYNLHTALRSNLSLSTLTPSIAPPTSTKSLPTPPFPRSHSSPSAFGTPTPLPPPTPLSGEIPRDPHRYTSALTPLLHRRLFITSSGHLGLGPAVMMSGDVVVVLFGGRVPFVLRKVDGEGWRLMGECYVHGIMEGEVLEGRAEGAENEWFDLI